MFCFDLGQEGEECDDDEDKGMLDTPGIYQNQ